MRLLFCRLLPMLEKPHHSQIMFLRVLLVSMKVKAMTELFLRVTPTEHRSF